MGIHYYFKWMKQTFPEHIKEVNNTNKNLIDQIGIYIDNFLIDMNGIIHSCCQKKYQYGSFKPQKSLIHPKKVRVPEQIEVFNEITEYIDKIVSFVNPQKQLFMAIDGPAPLAKIYQQRSRRARSSLENSSCEFDTCSITPGTKFLSDLSQYIHLHIKKKIKNKEWNFRIIFSDEKVPGEGEHECVKFVREYGSDKENYMIFGMDADLVMLSLATHKERFYILREDNFNNLGYCRNFFFIDMPKIKENLVNAMLGDFSSFKEKDHINDFILMIFLSGNDFLPNIPSIAISEGSVQTFFNIYSDIVKLYGPLTLNGEINKESLVNFMLTLGMDEKKFIEEKSPFFPDTLVEKYRFNSGNIDFEKFQKEYYKVKMNCNTKDDIKKACLNYIEGLQWVLSYYLKGVPSWKWFFPYNYSPFISDIAIYLPESVIQKYEKTQPFEPFMQLLCVLPKKSAKLLPSPLDELIKSYDITIDLSGKNKEWEGIVLGLEEIDFGLLEKQYCTALKQISEIDKKRNCVRKYRVFEN